MSEDDLTMESAGLMAPGERDRINRYIAAELLAWALECDQRVGWYPTDIFPNSGTTPDAYGGKMGRHVYKLMANDLRSRAFALAPPNPDDLAEIEARLAELRGR